MSVSTINPKVVHAVKVRNLLENEVAQPMPIIYKGEHRKLLARYSKSNMHLQYQSEEALAVANLSLSHCINHLRSNNPTASTAGVVKSAAFQCQEYKAYNKHFKNTFAEHLYIATAIAEAVLNEMNYGLPFSVEMKVPMQLQDACRENVLRLCIRSLSKAHKNEQACRYGLVLLHLVAKHAKIDLAEAGEIVYKYRIKN